MTSYISAALRRFAAHRADGLCEYCLIGEDDAYFGCQVDHIVSEKHGGMTDDSNLAYACVFCNRYKGSDIGSIVRGRFVRFFNPRTDAWATHFYLDRARIVARTDIGEATLRILRFNDLDRLAERELLFEMGLFPNAAALGRIQP